MGMVILRASDMVNHGADETCQVWWEDSDYQIAEYQISDV